MGSESSNSNSNSSKSDSDISSNSADNKNQLETMECHPENKNTVIQRVWISKKSITMHDEHVDFFSKITKSYLYIHKRLMGHKPPSENHKYQELHENVFNKEGYITPKFN